MSPKTCKFGVKDCAILSGYRALELCLSCNTVSHGKSLESGKELMTPSNFLATLKPQVAILRRAR